MITLRYLTTPDAVPTVEDFPSERLLCRRAVALVAGGLAVDLRINGSLMDPSAFAIRLTLIERRRAFVAQELLAQDKAANPAWAARYPDTESRAAYWRDMMFPEEREHLMERADRVIAAYEGALA